MALPRTIQRTLKPTTIFSKSVIILRQPSPFIPQHRPISTYGYTQAKALVYSKHGEPKDVLSYAAPSLSPLPASDPACVFSS